MSQPMTQGRNPAFQRFMALPLPEDVVQVEYVWIGGNDELRSKSRTLPGPIKSVAQLPDWNFDGSSTEQAKTESSEVWLRAVKFVPDPFRGRPHILVLCECLDAQTMGPIPTNTRRACNEIMEKAREQVPWFGIEQEYTLFENDGVTPLGFPKGGYPAPQGPYYCSAGAQRAFGRQVVESHYRACLYAGLTISGINAEVMAGQWEYQVGPCTGIDSGDSLWLSRYIMERVCEEFNVIVSWAPKPMKGDWNGAGCHTNYSTKVMREQEGDGYLAIMEAIRKLKGKHMEHMAVYGKGNQERLLGSHETARFDQFSWGVADRGSSIRVPSFTKKEGRGYFEDRRPAANMDPYLVTGKLVETTCLRATDKSGGIEEEGAKKK